MVGYSIIYSSLLEYSKEVSTVGIIPSQLEYESFTKEHTLSTIVA
jgi:hypothetical protein